MDLTAAIRTKRRALRRALLGWYTRCARDLPWRRTTDPYAVWVAEIMLQQTQVATVTPYYRRFMAAFPSVQALAAAETDTVLKLWEGLGYYRRARNLHAAAKVVAGELGGRFPRTAEQWRRLPGIGRYTAGAIASIALGEATPVLDGNVKRVLARLLGVVESIDAAATERALWAAADALVTDYRPGDANQALMELGARLCTPRSPQCPECPVRRSCDAFAGGWADQLPVRTPRPGTPHYEIVAAAIQRDGQYLLGQRPAEAMLGGLWEFPGGKVKPGETHAQALRREVAEELGVTASVGRLLGRVRHAYSHFSITLHLYACRVSAGSPEARYHTKLVWVRRADFSRYALPMANRKLLASCDL